MSNKFAPAVCAGLVAGVLALPAAAEDEGIWWFGGSLAATSDYVYRGVSQTDEGPALQASLDFGHESGLYAGIWASNVDFDEPDGIDLELNFYVGWTWEFADESELDLQLVRYQYPGANPGYGINYNELILAYSFLDHYTVTAAYANDWLNSDERALYYHLGAEIPLGVGELNLKLGAGFNDVSRLAGSDYWDFQVGINRDWGMFNVDLSYFNTSGFDADVQDVLGPRAWADGRVVLTVGVEF